MDPNLQALSTTQHEIYHKSPIDGQTLILLAEAALTWLRTNQKTVNALNVFPVPDGDTGTNMVLTMQAAYEEIANLAEHNAGKIAHAIAHGALMGARGNSGVILSQLWRGFARALDNLEILDGPTLVKALALGRDTAYKGVVRPVEGTILTVAKDVATEAEYALNEHIDDPHKILERVVLAAEQSVQRTPDLLPVLKEAGVVDAGGKGLFYILEGMVRWMNGQPLDTALGLVQPLASMKLENTLESIEPGQDWEVVVDFHPRKELDLVRFNIELQQIGTSIQIGEGDGIYRFHIHVPNDKRYEPINYAMSLGTTKNVTMENLIAEMEEKGIDVSGSKYNLTPIETGQIAVVAVAPGPGIARVFASLGAAAIVEGGQTMNPSTQEIITAFENLPTDKIIILPNNKNIIPAAQAAAQLTVKKVIVVPSHSVPQGLVSMMRLVPEGELGKVAADMIATLDEVETGEITTATRNVEIDGVAVQQGQIIALHNGKLVLAASSLEDACLGFLEKAHADHFELITLFYGAGVTGPEVNHIVDFIHSAYPNQTVENHEGGQPHYQFIISIE
jgi:DAK2 domain fusion protein YloV